MDVRVPFKGVPKGVEDADESRDEVFTLIDLLKHLKDNTAYSLEKAIQEGTVFQEEMAEVFIDSKNTVPVGAVD